MVNDTNQQPKRGKGFNENVYEFDFYSGSQISIYVGDVLIDDINSIQFNVIQSKRPVQGYASQYVHTFADGQVMVEGAFVVNFKEADYILATLARYRDKVAPIQQENIDSKKLHQVKRENIERLIRREEDNRKTQSKKGLLLEDSYDFYNSLSALPDEDFEAIAEAFEDTLWRGTDLSLETPNLPANFRDNKGIKDQNLYTYRRGDQYGSFDIYILYGDIHNKAANHTIKKIVGCEIVGQGQTISDDGEPIQEMYRFVGRNLA